MNKKLTKLAPAFAAILALNLTTGCQLAGLAIDDASEIKIDDASINSELKASLSKASKLAFFTGEPAMVDAARYIENNSKVTVHFVNPPGAVSPSQARQKMAEICKSSNRPDIVFYFPNAETTSAAGKSLAGALFGRTLADVEFTSDTLVCKTSKRSNFLTTGTMNASGVQVEDTVRSILGEMFGAELLRVIG